MGHDLPMTATVVLVHGAWHGAWCFDRVVPLLEEAGVSSVAVDLPGHGEDKSQFTDLHGDAARVMATLDGIDGEIVLLGHSYGGAVITEAGVHPAVTHLVYLCAMALDHGESCHTAAENFMDAVPPDGRPSVVDGLVVDSGGTSTLDPVAAEMCLYNQCDTETVNWALARIGPQPMQNLIQAPSNIAWRDPQATYIVCSDDLAIHPRLQTELAERCAYSLEWSTGHSPFASDPQLLSDFLVGLT